MSETYMPLRVDVGCGASCRAGFVGIDLNPRFGQTVAPVDDLPFDEGDVDEIHASHILEHTADPDATLREWFRVMKPGAKLTVRVPNLPVWVQRWLDAEPPEKWTFPLTAYALNWIDDPLMRHRSGFDVARLRSAVEGAGFAVVVCEAARTRAWHGPEYIVNGDLICEAVKPGASEE